MKLGHSHAIVSKQYFVCFEKDVDFNNLPFVFILISNIRIHKELEFIIFIQYSLYLHLLLPGNEWNWCFIHLIRVYSRSTLFFLFTHRFY